MKTISCDLCGSKVCVNATLEVKHTSMFYDTESSTEYDFCDSCFDEFMNWMKKEQDKKEGAK